MEIAIFENVIIESALSELEAEGAKYDGLYVDMNNAPARKYVKDKAALINTLKKQVERTRIDAAKSYKAEVEKQAAKIHERLDNANVNFQVLIDEYALERKKIIDAEKARKQAIIDADQKECDHEMALLINKTYEFDKAERQQLLDDAMKATEAKLMKELEERQQSRLKQEEQNKINAENARLADKEYKGRVNSMALMDLTSTCGITEEQAKSVIIAIAKKQITQISINY